MFVGTLCRQTSKLSSTAEQKLTELAFLCVCWVSVLWYTPLKFAQPCQNYYWTSGTPSLLRYFPDISLLKLPINSSGFFLWQPNLHDTPFYFTPSCRFMTGPLAPLIISKPFSEISWSKLCFNYFDLCFCKQTFLWYGRSNDDSPFIYFFLFIYFFIKTLHTTMTLCAWLRGIHYHL